MASTYTGSLRLNKQGTGDNDGTWGTVVNTQLDLLDDAISGVISKALVAGTNNLTVINGAADESRNQLVNLTGALAAAASVVMPNVEKVQAFYNGTTGGQTITVRTSNSGNSISIPEATALYVWTDGTTIRALSTPVNYTGSPVYVSIAASTGVFNGIVATSASVGTLNATVAVYSQLVSASAVNVGASVSVTGTLNVTNGIRTQTSVSIGSTLNVTGFTSLAGTAFTSDVSVSGSLFVKGSTSISGNLRVVGATTLYSSLGVQNIDCNATVSADGPVNGTNTCKAWLAMDGSGAGAVIRAGFNIGSTTRQGAGNYAITFTTPMADVNYAIVATGSNSETRILTTSISVGGCTLQSSNASGTNIDAVYLNVLVFR